MDSERVGEVRRLHCRQYGRCLNVAAAGNWMGFACAACHVDDLKSHAELLSEARGMVLAYSQIYEAEIT